MSADYRGGAMTVDPRAAAKALGDKVARRNSSAPGLGHRRTDCSLSIKIDPAAPLLIVIEPTASGRKWTARLGDRVLCVSAWPFVRSTRLLLAEGHPADTVIEAWRPNTDEWAMGGFWRAATSKAEAERVTPSAADAADAMLDV
jgi:hypothetical protein